MANRSLFAAINNAAQKNFVAPISGTGGWWPLIRESFSGAWQRNQEVSQQDMMGSPIVYSCMTLISNDIGTLPALIVQKDNQGIWSEAKKNSPYWAVLRKPNRYQNHIQFKEWWMMSKLRSGNTYALKERDARGIVVRLYILDHARVTPLVAEDGSVYYQLSQDNLSGIQESNIPVPASEIIHDRMNCLFHPLVGISPLYAAAIAAGVGIKIQNNALYFFTNNSRPSGILVAPGNISKENAEAMKEQWQSGYAGDNAGKVAVIGDGMKFEPMSQNAVDSQLIETLRWSDERVCSVFHVPPYKVGVGQAPSSSNTEILAREYYNSCLRVPIEEMEACLDEGLDHDGVNIGVHIDTEGLLRMDTKTQMETLRSGIEAKALTINDARTTLNRPPLDGGSTVYMQQQDYPLSEIKDNKLPAATSAPEPASAPLSDEDQAMLDELRAMLVTEKAIEAMRTSMEPSHV